MDAGRYYSKDFIGNNLQQPFRIETGPVFFLLPIVKNRAVSFKLKVFNASHKMNTYQDGIIKPQPQRLFGASWSIGITF